MKLRLFGFPVTIGAEFFVVGLFLGAASGDTKAALTWCVVLFVSVLVHELGHAVVARRLGHRAEIRLHGMGGTTHYDGGPPATWRSEVAIALAGPGFGLLLGGVVWIASRGRTLPAPVHLFVVDMLWANLAWSLWNLAPILPYDGGLAFQAVVERIAPGRGRAIANGVTLVLGLAGLVGCFLLRQWWIGYLYARAIGTAWTTLRKARHERRLSAAWKLWHAGDVDRARRETQALLDAASDETARALATELAIFVALRAMRADEAKAALDHYPQAHSPSDLLQAIVAHDRGDANANALLDAVPTPQLDFILAPLVLVWAGAEDPTWTERAHGWATAPLPHDVATHLGASLFHAGRFDLATDLHERLFARVGDPEAAYNAACSHARAGRLEAALGWLERAVDAGYEDGGFLDDDHDLDAIRSLPGFAGVRAKIPAAASA